MCARVSEHLARVIELGLPPLAGRRDVVLGDDLPDTGWCDAEVRGEVDDGGGLGSHTGIRPFAASIET